MPSSRSASPTSRSSDGSGSAPLRRGRSATRHSAALLARKLAFAPVLLAQALRTRRAALVMPEAAGPRAGVHGDTASTPPLRLLVAGDSSAAGVGVAHQDEAVLGHLVRHLHAATGRPIAWALHARSGLTTRRLHALLAAEPPQPADVAVVITGVNDVVEQIGARRAVRHRAALAVWLLDAGLARHVVFAPLPPVHQFPLLPEPLRRVMGADARLHDAALARWAEGRAGITHAAFDITLDAAGMARDGFHPGEPVYRRCGKALAEHVAKAAGVRGLAV